MRRLACMCIAAWAAIFTGCGAGGGVVAPPAGFTDEVRVPTELQAAYAEITTLIETQGAVTALQLVDTGTVEQRRALSLSYWRDSDPDSMTRDQFVVFGAPGTAGAEDSFAQSIAAKLGASITTSEHFLSSQWYVFAWPEDKPLGELAWTADWILQRYPTTIQFVEPNFLVTVDSTDSGGS